MIREIVGLRFGLNITRLMSSIVASGGQRPGHGPIGRRRDAKAGAGPKRLSSSPSLLVLVDFLVRLRLSERVCLLTFSLPLGLSPQVDSQFSVRPRQLSSKRIELVSLEIAELLLKSAHFVLQSSKSCQQGKALYLQEHPITS